MMTEPVQDALADLRRCGGMARLSEVALRLDCDAQLLEQVIERSTAPIDIEKANSGEKFLLLRDD